MNAQIRPGRFKLAWFAAGIAVLPLSVALVALILNLTDSFRIPLASPLAPEYWAPALAVIWLVNGLCIGFLQKAIVKRYLRVDLGRWTVYTSLGALLAGALAYPCFAGDCIPPQFYDYGFVSDLTFTVEISLVSLVYLTLLSAVQCLALNRLISGSWRWIAAHVGPLILVAAASVMDQMSPSSLVFDVGLTFALYVLAVTVSTGLVMQRLLASNRRANKEPIDQWAYQPVPIEPESAEERSVWDNAIQ